MLIYDRNKRVNDLAVELGLTRPHPHERNSGRTTTGLLTLLSVVKGGGRAAVVGRDVDCACALADIVHAWISRLGLDPIRIDVFTAYEIKLRCTHANRWSVIYVDHTCDLDDQERAFLACAC